MRLRSRIWYLVALAPFVPLPASAESIFDNARRGLSAIGGAAGVSTSQSASSFVGSIVNTAISILGLIAMALILYAGGLWLTAAGNDDKVSEAKAIIRTTVIGIVVVGLAYSITAFIISLVA